MAAITDPPTIYMAIDAYLSTVGQHPTAEEMMHKILTEDFETRLRGGDTWRGIEGVRELLAARAGFFDQRSELKALLSMTPCSHGEVEVTTRIDFFMRRWKPPSPVSEEFRGTSFHTWRLRCADNRLRVASLIIDGFANLNDSARRLIASPVLGADTEE